MIDFCGLAWLFQFSKEAGHVVEECRLRVVYASPPQPPSPVPEGSEEGNSPRGSISDNGHFSTMESAAVSSATFFSLTGSAISAVN